MFLMDVVGKAVNLLAKFSLLISTAVVSNVSSKRLQKVLVEICCRTRNFHTQNCNNKSMFEFFKIFQLLLSDVLAIFD